MTHHLHEDDGTNLFPYSETGTSGCLSVDSEAQRFARVTRKRGTFYGGEKPVHTVDRRGERWVKYYLWSPTIMIS
jgi:hypothetical protein